MANRAVGNPPSEADSRPLPSLARRLAGQPAWVPIILVALLARMPGLASRPLWYDEALAVLLSSKGPAAVLEATLSQESGIAANVHPPGYFMLLWGWSRLFGTAAWTARLPSIIAGLGTVALAYRQGRQHLGGWPGKVAGWLLALAPFQVHYAQEVRMYCLLGLLLIAAASLYGSAMRRGGLWRWAGFAVLAAAAQYTHSLAAAFLLPLSLIPVIRRSWGNAVRTGLSGALALVLYAPWLLQFPAQWARVQRAYWITPVGAADLVRTLVIFVAGSPLPAHAIPVGLFTALWLLLIGGWALARGRGRADPAAGFASAAAYLALAPPVIMFVVSLRQPIYLDRAMLPAGVAFLCWGAWAVASGHTTARLRWTGGALLAASFGLGLFSYYTYRGFPYAPFPDLVDRLQSRLAPGEIILHSNKLSAIPAAYYAPDLAQAFLPDAPGSASDTLAEATRSVLGVEQAADLPSAAAGAEGVWFIVFEKELDEFQAAGYRQHPSLSWLRARFSRQQVLHFGELTVYHFSGILGARMRPPAGPGFGLGRHAGRWT